MVTITGIFSSGLRLPSCTTKQPRRCRASQSRTLNYVRSSLDAWSWIYQQPPVNFQPVFSNCADLAACVKRLLASCPSSDPRQVMAYQSIKKGLPDSCRCMERYLLGKLVDNIVAGSPPSLPRGYLQFVKKEVSRLFPKGWDSSYEGFCRRNAPSLKGTLESGRAQGGCLGELVKRGFSYSDYLDVCLFGRASPWAPNFFGGLQVVQSAGKPRPLTTFTADGQFLRPLHKTIYSSLSRKSWLCRGEITSASLSGAGFLEGQGLLISGDYSSATDNLSIEVMEVALDAMLDNAIFVPTNIRELAKKACRPLLFENRDDYEAYATISATNGKARDPSKDCLRLRKGQMMGSYLSFPFLCLQNYLAFRWSTRSVRHRIPLLINGDDILFQAEESVAREWMETVGSLGLEVEKTKTSIEPGYGSLNSTLLTWSENGDLQVCPTLRFGMLRSSEYPTNLGVQFSNFLRGITDPTERWRAGRVFFEFHIGTLRNTSFSLPALGFRGSLAHRLARVYGLLSGDRLNSLPPRAPCPHTVSLSPDLVSEVPKSSVDPWIRDFNSGEVASWKWSHGFSPTDYVSEGIQYALRSTRWSDYHWISGLFVNAMSCSNFSFQRWARGWESRSFLGSRRTLLEPFLTEPFRSQSTQLMDCVVDECYRRTDRFGERLPTYEEALEWGAGGA